jgi:uncharacterized protein YbjT (DUF2867 family)
MDRGDKTILVTGATGHQGGAAARHLLEDGWHVRALTRDPSKPAARTLAELGCEVVRGNLKERATLDAALSGAYGCYSVQTPRDGGPEAEEAEGRNLADAAKAAGVQHFVYDSVIGAGRDDATQPWVVAKHRLERYVRDSGLPYTIWRPSTFMENYLGQLESIANGVLRGLDAPDGIKQMIAVDDIGRFVALAFREREQWLGRTTLIAGDRMTAAEVADTFGRVLGRPVRYEQTEPPPGMTAPPKTPLELADLDVLRHIMPGLKTLEEWARTIDWSRVGAAAPGARA